MADTEVARVPHEIAKDALEAAEELAEVFFKWILPILLIIVGIFVVNQIGLSGALGTAFSELSSISASGVILVADLVAAGIWGGIGAALWAFADGKWGVYIMHPIAGLFIGFSIGELFNALAGKVGNGSIGTATSKLETSVSKIAKGG
ncbi:MAG: hypothetical protein ACREEC_04285 [Thermoplasmata archaeon]